MGAVPEESEYMSTKDEMLEQYVEQGAKRFGPMADDPEVGPMIRGALREVIVGAAALCAQDWRFQAAKAAMQGLLAGGAMNAAADNNVPPREVPDNVAAVAVMHANALLAALDKPTGGA